MLEMIELKLEPLQEKGESVKTSIKLKTVRNIIWLVCNGFLSTVSNMCINFLLARKMGAGVFGEWSLILATTSWVMVLRTAAGSDMIRKSAQDSQYARLAFVPVLLALIIGGSLFGVVGIFFNLAIIQTSSILMPCILIALAFVGITVFIIPISLFAGRDRMEWQLGDSVNSLLILTGLLVLSKYGLTVNTVAKTYLIASLIVCVPLMVFGAWVIKPILWRGTKALVQRFIIDLGQLFITNWLYLLHCGLDLYLLQLLMSSVEVGLYNAALKLVIALGMVPFLFLMSVTPEMTRRTFASDFAFVRRFWVDATRLFALSAGGLVVFILIMADYIIRLAYGSTYEPTTIILRILSISLIPRFLQTVVQSMLFAAGQYKNLIWGFAVGLLVQTTGGLLLIPYFGPKGAAVAFLMAECATLVIFAVFASRTFGRPPVLVIGKVFVWSLAAVSVTFLGLQLKLPVALLFSSVTIFCLLLSYCLGCISVRDIQLGKSMLVELVRGKA